MPPENARAQPQGIQERNQQRGPPGSDLAPAQSRLKGHPSVYFTDRLEQRALDAIPTAEPEDLASLELLPTDEARRSMCPISLPAADSLCN